MRCEKDLKMCLRENERNNIKNLAKVADQEQVISELSKTVEKSVLSYTKKISSLSQQVINLELEKEKNSAQRKETTDDLLKA